MARNPRLSPAEQEIQDHLKQVSAGQAGINPQAQTLARSSSNPRAQREGQQMVEAQARQNARNAEDSARESERVADETARAQAKAAADAAAAQKSEQARNVRAAAAEGVATTTDIETGRRTIKTHDDGAPVFKPGPVGPVAPIGTAGARLEEPGAAPRDLPNSNIMLGGDGAAATTGEPERMTVFAEPIRDDRGNVRQVQPEPKTDKASGFQYVEGTDKSTGLPTKTTVGVDENQRRSIKLGQQLQQIDLQDNAHRQAKQLFEPRWQPVKAEFLAATQEWESLSQAGYERRQHGWVKKSATTGKEVLVTPEIGNAWEKQAKEAKARLDRAKQAYDTEAPRAENLTKAGRDIAAAKLRLMGEKIRLDAGLPAEDGGISLTLAEAEAGPSPASQAASAAADEVIPPEAPKPVTADEALAKAFGGVPGIEGVTLDGTDVGYSWMKRDGATIGRVDNRGESPVIVLNPEANDLQAHIATKGESSIPVYLADNPDRPSEQENAGWAAGALQVVSQPVQGPLADGQTKAPEIDQDAALKAMGAGYDDITRRVKDGTLSVRMGEALMQGIYGDTLKAEDPAAPETFQKFLTAQPPAFQREWAAANKDRDPAKLDELRGQFISEWYSANQHKPGVTFAQQKALRGNREARGVGDIAEGLAKGAGGVAVDALGSMGGMIGGTAALIGLTIASPFSDTSNDLRKAQADVLGRGFVNFNRGLESNFKKHLTGEGKARLAPLATSSFDLKTLIENRQSMDPQEFKSKMLAAAAQVGKDALAVHELNQEDGWQVEAGDFDIMQDKALGSALLSYAETGDPADWETFQRRLLLDKGSRQAEELAGEVSAGKGRLAAAFAGGVNAPPQEMLIELLSTVATFGAGKVIGATGKAALKTGTEGARLARLRRAMAGISDDFAKFGKFTDTLANPASKGKRIANKAVGMAKAQAVEASGEAVEEAVAGMADPTATAESVAKQAGAGFVGGFILGPLIAAPGAITQGRNERLAKQQEAKKFSDWYNQTNADTPGFTPLAPAEADAALAMLDPVTHGRLVADHQQAMSEFAEATEEVGNSQAPGEVGVAGTVQQGFRESAISRMSRARAKAAETRAAVTNYVGGVVEASQSTKGMEAPARAKILGLTKAATGRTDLLTSTERQAIAGLQTKDGAPYFVDVAGKTVFTAEGRAEVQTENPLVGGLIQTDESQALIEQAAEQFSTPQDTANPANPPQPTPTNEPNQQGAPGPQAAQENAPTAGTSGQAPGGYPAVGRSQGDQGAAPPRQAADVAQETPAGRSQAVNPAELDAAEYEAYRQQNPGAPDIPTVVAQAKAAGRPVSKSMEKAAGNVAPSNTSAKPVAKTFENEQVGSAIQRAESRFPALKGRFVVDQTSEAVGSGGAYMLNGKVVINLADARIDLEGYDVDAIPARLDAVLAEEIVHLAQLEAALRGGERMETVYAALWAEFTPQQQKAAAAAYQGNFEEQQAWQRGAETVRMLVQQRMDGKVTELTKAFSRNMPARLIALLKSAVEFLREVVASGQVPERVQQAIDAIEAMLAEFSNQGSSAEAQGKTGAPEGQTDVRPDVQSKAADSQSVTAKADGETSAPMSNKENASTNRDANEFPPLRIIGEAITAAKAKDERLTPERARELEFAIEDLDTVLEGMESTERRPFIDAAIDEWLESLPVEEAPAEAPTKAPRKNPYRAKALQIIASGDYKTIYALSEEGKLQRNPPIIGLILNRKDSGKKLTEKEMSRMRSKKDGMPTQAMFQGYGPKGKLAAEVLSILTVPYGQGETADTLATNIEQGWTDQDLFAALTEELMQITRGERFKNQELDPNREWTDEEIAAAEARNADPERDALDEEPGYVPPETDEDGEILFSSPVASFASGIDKPADALGAIRSGVPIGTTAQALQATGLRNVFKGALRANRQVFIDSGAFSAFTRGKAVSFEQVFDLYDEMATAGPAALSVVGPDVVGNQVESIALVRKHAGRIRKLIDSGARVILPVQMGEMDIAAYLKASGFTVDEVAIGLPSNKAGYSRRLLRDHLSTAGAKDVHFLGMSDQNRDARTLIDAAKESGVEKVTMDANRIRSKAGREIREDEADRSSVTDDMEMEALQDLQALDMPERRALLAKAGMDASRANDWNDALLEIEATRPEVLRTWLADEMELPKQVNQTLRERRVADALRADEPIQQDEQGALFASPSIGGQGSFDFGTAPSFDTKKGQMGMDFSEPSQPAGGTTSPGQEARSSRPASPADTPPQSATPVPPSGTPGPAGQALDLFGNTAQPGNGGASRSTPSEDPRGRNRQETQASVTGTVTPAVTQAEAAAGITKAQAKDILAESSLKDRPIRTYEQAVAANQIHMGTRIPEWSAFPFTGEKSDGQPVQDLTGVTGMEKAPTMFRSSGIEGQGNCEWCGKQPVKNFFHIKHDGKKWSLAVGSECIGHFANVSGEQMAAEARENLGKTQVMALEEAMGELSKEFRHSVYAGYGRTETKWRTFAAEALWRNMFDTRGQVRTDSSRSALSRWLNTKAEAVKNLLSQHSELMAKPETLKMRIEWRQRMLRELDGKIQRKSGPQWEIDSWTRRREEIAAELAELEKPAVGVNQPASGETQAPEARTGEIQPATPADWKSRERFVGEDFAGPADSIVIQFRDGDSNPLGDGQPVTLPLGKDIGSTISAAERAFYAAADERGASLRESLIKLIGPDGKAFAQLANRNGRLAPARQDELEKAREVLKQMQERRDGTTAGQLSGPRIDDEKPKPFKKASTQINLPERAAKRVMEFAATIPESEIYSEKGYGREDEPHVTVLYGLTTDDSKQAEKALAGIGPITFRLGKVSVFENEDYDVLKIDVAGPDLHRANKKLRDEVPFENDYPDYKPHVTIAYLKPGMGKKYAGASPLEGMEMTAKEVLYSGKDRTKTPIGLMPSAETAKPAKVSLTGSSYDEMAQQLPEAFRSTFEAGEDFNVQGVMARLFSGDRSASDRASQSVQLMLDQGVIERTERNGLFRLKPIAEAKPAASPAPAAKPKEGNLFGAPTTPGKIEDFGEKILGARKDTWGKFKTAIEQALPEDGADITVAKYFPEPDYEVATANGIAMDSLATYKALRDSIPAKPRQPYKLRRWVDTVRALHPIMQRLVQGEALTPAEFAAMEKAMYRGGDLAEKINLYRDLGYPAFTKADDWKILSGVTKFYRGNVKLGEPERVIAALFKGRFVDGMESTDLDRPGYIEIIGKIRARILAELQSPAKKEKKAIEFSILQDRITRDVFIGKKALNGWIRMKTGFTTPKEAREYIADHQQELEEQWEGMKKPVDYRKQVNAPRQGPERRPGDVTPEMFADAFGFRGVQFGNWVEENRRQVDINEAFDAFMDMAEALGIPPKAVSLDGSLGLAFGARGIPNAKAHYEPDNVVINLSKKSGPGSLAHEWFHAFDNYFARLDITGQTKAQALDKFATNYSAAPRNMRPEVWEAFKRIRQTLETGTFADRSRKLDDAKGKPYYSQMIEKAARAFERYTVDRLETTEISNDFLVNLTKDNSPALPNREEMDAGIRQAYDNLFNVLDTKETDRGTALFSSRTQPDLFAAAQAPDATQKLGTVKIGSKNALGAYRALTAKREAGKTLTADEEQTLLDAETALGQKMAFDMEAVTAPAPLIEQPPATVTAKASAARSTQQDMSLGSEVLKDGQITLFSSPSNQAPTKIVDASPPDSFPDARSGSKELAEWARQNLRGDYPVPALQSVVGVTRYGIDHTAQQTKRNPERMRAIGILPQLLDQARIVREPDGNIFTLHALGLIEGKLALARITVEQREGDNRGKWYRFYDLKGFEIEDAPDAFSAFPSEDGSILANPGRSVTLARLAEIVKKVEGGDVTLFSSPTPESQAAVEQALEKMPPIYRAVFEAVAGGMSETEVAKKFSVTPKAVTNILNAVRSRITSATTASGPDGLKPAMRDGLIDGGRPDLALSTIPEVAAIDQIRNDSDVPGTREWEEVLAAADQRIEADYAGEYDRILEAAHEQRQLSDVETAIAKRLIARETMQGRTTTADQRTKLAMLIHGYRDIGTETARSLAIRRDPHKTPAERHAMFIAEALFTPDEATRAEMRKAKKGKVEDLLKGWLSRVDAIKAELLAQGIDLDATLAEFNAKEQARKDALEESPRAAKAIDETFRKLTKREKAVIEAVRSGSTWENVTLLTGMPAAEAQAVYRQFYADINAAMAASAKRYLEQSLAASAMENTMRSILDDLGVPHPDDIATDAVDVEVKKRQKKEEAAAVAKVRKEREKPKPKEKPAFAGTPEQEARWKALADKWRAAPFSTWRTLWQDEMNKLGPIFGVSFERARDEFLAPWRALWQTEMDLRPQEGRMTFEEWMEKPETREKWKKQPELFAEPINETTGPGEATARVGQGSLGLEEINERTGEWKDGRPLPMTGQADLLRDQIDERTGTFDLNDPLKVKQVLDAFSYARPGKLSSQILEFWKAAILSGPQTMAVNAGSNALNSLYNLLPRRLVEAAINNLMGTVGLGSKEAATFREFNVMAGHVFTALKEAAKLMVRSWRLENSDLFEAYASAESVQLSFGGDRFDNKGRIEPALKGWTKTIMHAISFRHLTAADQFFQAFNGRLEAMAQAHRIAASEEGLKGDAYAARMKVLVEPGSVAWIRSIDLAKQSTFQQEIDGKRAGAINIVDSAVEWMNKGRQSERFGPAVTLFFPFLNTPANVFKRGIEISPLGLALAVVDGMHALARKYRRGGLSKELADQQAAEYYNRARLIQDLTNQTVGLGLFLVVNEMLEGGEDDELPMITGTLPFTVANRGEREIAERVMPPMSVRIGSVIIPYGRIEPFALPVAMLVDSVSAVKRNKGLNSEAVGSIVSSFSNKIGDMPMLEGAQNIMNLAAASTSGSASQAERVFRDTAGRIVTGFIPNLIRQPLREIAPNQVDSSPRQGESLFSSMARRIGYSIMPQAGPAKIDAWGNEVPMHRGGLFGGTRFIDAPFRVIDPTNSTVGVAPDPIDLWMFNYNQSKNDPKERIGLQAIQNYVKFTPPGESKPRSFPIPPEEYEQALKDTGKQARAMLGDGWTKDRPFDEQQKEVIERTYKSVKDAKRQELKMRIMARGIPPVED